MPLFSLPRTMSCSQVIPKLVLLYSVLNALDCDEVGAISVVRETLNPCPHPPVPLFLIVLHFASGSMRLAAICAQDGGLKRDLITDDVQIRSLSTTRTETRLAS